MPMPSPGMKAIRWVAEESAMLLAFELVAIPMREIRTRFVGALAELKDSLVRPLGCSHVAVPEHELSHLLVPVRRARPHKSLIYPIGRGLGVGIESRLFDLSIARPKAATDHFVRVSLARQGIHVFWQRTKAAGEARHSQIKGTPEKLHRAAFADEPGPKHLEHSIAVDQDASKALNVLNVVRGV